MSDDYKFGVVAFGIGFVRPGGVVREHRKHMSDHQAAASGEMRSSMHSILRLTAACLTALVLTSQAASGCTCSCVNGWMTASCSDPNQVPPICQQSTCPMVPSV